MDFKSNFSTGAENEIAFLRINGSTKSSSFSSLLSGFDDSSRGSGV